MSGFGGGWARRTFADVAHYPAFSAWKAAHDSFDRRSATRWHLPEAVGEVSLSGSRDGGSRMRGFPRRAECGTRRFCRTVHDSALARHHRRRDAQCLYDTEDRYLDALGRALQVEYETIVAHGFVLQIDAPDLAMERHLSYQDKPLTDFVDFVERVAESLGPVRQFSSIPGRIGRSGGIPSFRPQSIQLMELTPASPETNSQSQLLRAPSCPAANLVRPNSSPSWSSGTPLDVRSSPSSSFRVCAANLRRRRCPSSSVIHRCH